MSKSGAAILGAAVLAMGLGLSADNNAAPQAKQTQTAAPKMAASHATAPASGMTVEAQSALIKQYCVGCHSEKGKAGGLSLVNFDPAQAYQNAETAEKMIHKLRAGMMPPPTAARRPDGPTTQAFAAALESRIDEVALTHVNPGHRVFQRLNRAEYERAVHDLLDITVDVNAFLPPDTISESFDNIADTQAFSPTLLEGYLRAASKISSLAIGDKGASPTEATYKVPRNQSQMHHIDGTPFGTRGGLAVLHNFPADGEYSFRILLHGTPTGQLYGSVAARAEQLEISIDGERAALLDIDYRASETGKQGLNIFSPRLHIKAGPHHLAAAFIQKFDGPIDDLMAPIDYTLADTESGDAFGITTLPHLRDFSVTGPYKVTGVSDTPSREKIFVCRPTSPDEEPMCAKKILGALATEAYRRPAKTTDVDALMKFYDQGRKDGDFESGIRLAVQALLASPNFVFRFEEEPAAVKPGQNYKISDVELASRLSFFLWQTVPDAELLKVTKSGTLRQPAVLEKQVRRMLADPRAETLSTRFASLWLRLQDVDKIKPDALLFPSFDDRLSQAYKRETQLLFNSIVREDRNVMDLINADYTFVNERTAKVYGIPNITGNEFQRVTVPEERRGILGQGSVLMLTSVADRTSPVQRGKWVLEVLFGSPPPPPPPGVPLFEETKGVSAAGKILTVRERMEEHRKNPACTSCHRMMDPLGLSLENFDVVGAWRIKDNGSPVDTAGTLYDGTPLTGPASLRVALNHLSTPILRNFTERLLSYAIGRRVEYYDEPAVRTILRRAEQNNDRFSSFVLGIVNSAAFQMSKAEAVETNADSQPSR